MKELFAVYLESLDQDLKVYTDKEQAEKRYDELKAAGKPVKMELRWIRPTDAPRRILISGKR